MNFHPLSFSPDNPSNLILDLVSKFLSNILEKDANNSFYLKQWESFKNILCIQPIDLSKAASFLSKSSSQVSEPAKTQENFYPQSYPSTQLISNLEAQTSIDQNEDFLLQESTKLSRGISLPTSPKMVIVDTGLTKFASLKSQPVKKAIAANRGVSSPGSINELNAHKSFNSAAVDELLADLRSDSSSKMSSPTKFPEKSNEISGLNMRAGQAKLQTGRLNKLAKNLRNKIQTHNKNLTSSTRASSPSSWEERTPLRKIKVYEKRTADSPPTDLSTYLEKRSVINLNGTNNYGLLDFASYALSKPTTPEPFSSPAPSYYSSPEKKALELGYSPSPEKRVGDLPSYSPSHSPEKKYDMPNFLTDLIKKTIPEKNGAIDFLLNSSPNKTVKKPAEIATLNEEMYRIDASPRKQFDMPDFGTSYSTRSIHDPKHLTVMENPSTTRNVYFERKREATNANIYENSYGLSIVRNRSLY